MKNLKKLKFLIASSAVCMGMLLMQSVSAETAVIVHPSNSSALDVKSIKRIFLGKLKSFPGGSAAVPIDLTAGDDVRKSFNGTVLKKSGAQVKSYWAKRVFTGKGNPPKEVKDSAEAKKLVSANPNIIGYINASMVDASVKVVHKF